MHLRQNLTPRQNQWNWIICQTNAGQINQECLKAKQWPGGKEELIASAVCFFLQQGPRWGCRKELEPWIGWTFHCWTGQCLAQPLWAWKVPRASVASVAQEEQNEKQNVLLKPNSCSWDRGRLRPIGNLPQGLGEAGLGELLQHSYSALDLGIWNLYFWVKHSTRGGP